MNPLLDMQGLADYLGKSLGWVRKEVAAGRIPFTRVGKSPRFTEEHVRQILAAGEQPVASAPRRLAAVPALKAPGPSSPPPQPPIPPRPTSPPRGERKENAA